MKALGGYGAEISNFLIILVNSLGNQLFSLGYLEAFQKRPRYATFIALTTKKF